MKKKHTLIIIIILISIISILVLVENRKKEVGTICISPCNFQELLPSNTLYTDKEIQWLIKNQSRAFIVGIAKDYTPIEYFSSTNCPKGIGIEVLRKISQQTGLKFQVYENNQNETWAEILESFRIHKIDILSAVSFTDKRSDFINFSTPYIETTLVIIGHKKNSRVLNGLANTGTSTFAIPKGYWINDVVFEQNPKTHIVYVDNMSQALHAVNSQKADYTVCEIPIFTFYKEQQLYHNLKIVGELKDKNSIMLGTQKDEKTLLSIMNKTMLHMDHDELYENALVMPQTKRQEKRLIFIIMVLLVILSITSYYLYKSIKALVVSKRKAEIAYHEKTQFMTNISHDLRTPITVILGYSNAILDEEVTCQSDIKKYIQRICLKTQYLNTMIHDLFTLSKLENHQLAFNLQAVKINPFIENIINTLEVECLSKNIDIKLDLDQRINFEKHLDEYKIHQALENIISNSIKHVENNGRIIVGTQLMSKDKVKIWVQDNGCGISEKDIPYVFDRYFKGKKGDESSTGLGLYIAKEIIEKHDGQIWVKSQVNEGSTFYILI